MEKSTYRFTSSVIVAIEAMMRLASPQGLSVKLKGTGLGERTRLSSPAWCNFDFFSAIEALRINRKKRVDQTADRRGYWVVERQVYFHFRDILVGVISLEGHKSDGTKGNNSDNATWWAISKIAYKRDINDDHSWRTVECEVIAHSSTSVSEV